MGHETNLATQHLAKGSNALSCAQHSGLYQWQVDFLPGTWRFLCGLGTQRTEGHKHSIISMKKKSPTQMKGAIKLTNYIITIPEYTSLCSKHPQYSDQPHRKPVSCKLNHPSNTKPNSKAIKQNVNLDVSAALGHSSS